MTATEWQLDQVKPVQLGNFVSCTLPDGAD